MYQKKVYGFVLSGLSFPQLSKGTLDTYQPETTQSTKWRYWKAILDLKLCPECRNHHGTIFAMTEVPNQTPPLHENCRCSIIPAKSVSVGNATKDGKNGADYWLTYQKKLPDYYISIDDILKLQWRHGKPPRKYAPGKMVFGGVFQNQEGHLPNAPGRIWYEADINYYEGHRNMHRLLFSNDGLMFVTYDHYTTFYEVAVPEKLEVADEED